MAWTFRRSALDRYCPNFEAEYPAGVTYATSALHKTNGGVAVDGATLPRRMRLTTPHTRLPEFLLLEAVWVVSDTFRQLVEMREPGVHQFFPIDVLDRDGEPIGRHYSIFVICQRLAAVVLEKSGITWRTGPTGSKVPVANDDQLVLDKQVIVGKHVWRNVPYFGQFCFISNELKDAIDSIRLIGINFTHVSETEQ